MFPVYIIKHTSWFFMSYLMTESFCDIEFLQFFLILKKSFCKERKCTFFIARKF